MFRLFSLDDQQARDWLPFAVTRPVGELLFGTETLRARTERVLGQACEGNVTSSALAGFQEEGAPPWTATAEIRAEAGRLFLSSRFVPDEAGGFREGLLRGMGNNPVLLVARHRSPTPQEPAGAWLPPGTPIPPELADGRWPEWPTVPVEGRLLCSPWDLMDANADQIRADAKRFANAEQFADADGFTGPHVSTAVHRLGDGRIALHETATVEPGVVLDATAGPIVLEAGVVVRAHSRIAGPFYAGPGTTLLGGSVSASSLGPRCKVRGEVESSVILGFANKAHDGHLGRSIVGRWANLGAMTTNSDLKNSYGPVRARVRGQRVDTGLLKAGCLLGDHVRTAIGTLLDTGSVVEAGSCLFGSGLAPKYVPPFCWGAGRDATGHDAAEHDIERFLVTAERVMARRGVKLSDGMRNLYRRAFAETAHLRTHH